MKLVLQSSDICGFSDKIVCNLNYLSLEHFFLCILCYMAIRCMHIAIHIVVLRTRMS